MARKILLADDSVTAQNMGRKILADAGYEVITVNNGSAALKKIAEAKPDLIVLDVYMPGYSGLEVCQRLKEAQETSRIPILLTVGKLEPFKPEEAKRVRAEGFIVKPFEASELLSALSKLEDKIVPRAESSKPGRFARANAALDEGRYDKTVAVEEDSGWKNRIAFPSKKKKVAQEEDGDDPAIYNAINKDLRTTVEHKPAHQAHAAKAEESTVDLGALAPEGLPKDVTPEEIAALAAAAAQVKGKLSETAVAEPVPEQPVAAAADTKTEFRTEEKPEAKEETRIADELPKESSAAAATFAQQKSEEHETSAAKPAEVVKDAADVTVPSPSEMMAAIAGLVPEAAHATDSSSGNGLGSHGVPEHHAAEHHAADDHAADRPRRRHTDEPVTMAVAAGAGSGGAASRWTAVSVALAPDEAATSLEHEMQKAHAAFAAADIAHGFVTSIQEIPRVAAEPAAVETISPVEAVTPELVGPLPTDPVPEAARAMSAVASAGGTITPVVKEFETIAASSVDSQSSVQPPAPSEPEPAPVQAAETQPQFASEAKGIETKAEEPPVAEAVASQPEPTAQETTKAETTHADMPEPVHEEQKHEEQKHEEPAPVEAVVAVAAEEASAGSEEKPETSASTFEREVSADHFASPVSLDHIERSPVEAAAGGTRDTGKKESEIAETTAAAWASWRRIRESGDSKGTPAQPSKSKPEAEEESTPQDEAAMAVAAGAEKAPEEAPAQPEDSGEIANIVDSVLAEMRPKIVAEISKKMGKKK